MDTGKRTYSGTGRNQATTRLVSLYSNYEAIPATFTPVATTGSAIKLSPIGAEVLAPYWGEFESASRYEVLITEQKVPACFVTRTGDKPVGALYRSKSSAGSLLLLPDIDFYPDNFLKQKKDGAGHTWTPSASQFARRMVASIVALDKSLRASAEITPEPVWASDPKFQLNTEVSLKTQLLEAEQRVEEAQKIKESVAEALNNAGAFRGLLFEKGKPLENIIIEALRLFGFKAAQYKESDSEFDVVFESEEGRLIGEAEGKDTKAVNIDKLRQLSMNIHEDLQREEITSPAKPVLFGNGYRLQSVQERPDPFTEKCHTAATSSSTALVFTPDLFKPVQYLISNRDEKYVLMCRQVLLSTCGRVVFPEPPTAFKPNEETDIDT